ncbi:MAG: hypothetical protein R3A51_08680 [Nannocystaceae bacterium]
METNETTTVTEIAAAQRIADEARARLRHDPEDEDAARALAAALDQLRDHDPPERALAAAEERLALERGALARAPDDPARLRGLVVCLRTVGDARRSLQAWDDALAAHEEAVTAARRLLALEPGGTAGAWELSVSLNRVGLVHEERGAPRGRARGLGRRASETIRGRAAASQARPAGSGARRGPLQPRLDLRVARRA